MGLYMKKGAHYTQCIAYGRSLHITCWRNDQQVLKTMDFLNWIYVKEAVLELFLS